MSTTFNDCNIFETILKWQHLPMNLCPHKCQMHFNAMLATYRYVGYKYWASSTYDCRLALETPRLLHYLTWEFTDQMPCIDHRVTRSPLWGMCISVSNDLLLSNLVISSEMDKERCTRLNGLYEPNGVFWTYQELCSFDTCFNVSLRDCSFVSFVAFIYVYFCIEP